MKLAFDVIYKATMGLLPPSMDSMPAKAMLMAIALQESRCEHRRQMNDGPARGFWQFEQAGIRGVLTHPATRDHIRRVLDALRYDDQHPVIGCWNAVEHNDLLACSFARLNLFWLPAALPGPENAKEGWNQYISAWRPGKPHPQTWPAFYAQAWQHVSSA